MQRLKTIAITIAIVFLCISKGETQTKSDNTTLPNAWMKKEMARLDSFEIAKKEIAILKEKSDSLSVVVMRSDKALSNYRIKDSATHSLIRSYAKSDSLHQSVSQIWYEAYRSEKKRSFVGYAVAALVLIISIFR